ncbi:MAG: ribonucleoside-diphosphate reductase subunit alpha [Promethearchaeia archaeon]
MKSSKTSFVDALASDLYHIRLEDIRDFLEKISKLEEDDLYFELIDKCRTLGLYHPEWSLLAGRLLLRSIKTIPKTFSESTQKLKPILHPDYYSFVMKHSARLDSMIHPERDLKMNIFAVGTLIKSYLARIKKDKETFIYETPQYMYLRVATFLWYSFEDEEGSLDNIRRIYDSLSLREFSHASPTLFNAGMSRPQLASCFTMTVYDSMQSISSSWKNIAIISMLSGGVGIDVNPLRHSEIGQYGESRGIVPWIKIIDQILHTVDQCFHPDTIVYTVNDGPKPISQVTSGDTMIRIDGKKNRVLKPIMHTLRDKTQLYSLSIKHYTQPIIVSEEHPILSFNGQVKGTSFKMIIKKLENKSIIPSFIDVKELNENSFVGIPIPAYEKDLPHYTMEACRMYGILLGDGYFNKKRNEVTVYLNSTTKLPTINFVKGYLKRHNIHYWETEKNSSIGWTARQAFFPFTREMLYDEGDDKHFHPPFLHLPLKKLEQIFLGLMETNGTYRTGKEIYLELSSPQVMESIRYILLRMGVGTSGYHRDRRGNVSKLKRGGEIITKKESVVLRIPRTENVCKILGRDDPSEKVNFFVYDKKIWSRVVKIEPVDVGSDFVVDLEMESKDGDDLEITANYLTCIGSAHNGGKRKGSGCIYIEPWHIDVEEYLDLKKPTGKDDLRARGLFYALWISDEFMRRVESDSDWTLFCPNKVKQLGEKWGADFEMCYKSYEEKAHEGKISHYRVVKARKLWKKIINSQIETGGPFILYKDAINRKCNQINEGMIHTSNLCTEITLVTNSEQIGTCNLAAVALDSCVEGSKFYFEKLELLTRILVRNLDQVIDRSYYPEEVPQIEFGNKRNRPLGIGVHGLATAFAKLDLAWESPEAKELNKFIFETIYYSAIKESIEIAKEKTPYPSFYGSPASKGLFQFDLWDLEKIQKDIEKDKYELSLEFLTEHSQPSEEVRRGRYDWESLRSDMMRHGLRHSLLIALMPTASSANIIGNSPCIEPDTSLIFSWTVLSGQYIYINPHMVKDLEEIDMWNKNTSDAIIAARGSIQSLAPNRKLPGSKSIARVERLKYLKKKYKTIYEIPQKLLLDMALDRARYVCQSESHNCWMTEPTFTKLNAYHFHGWKNGIKTGMYYLRQPARDLPTDFVAVKKCTDEVCTSCET